MTEPNDTGARQGYLLLADISGYTRSMTGTELEHSHAIIRELTRLIRARLAPPMRFAKLEGDAVFCYADAAAFAEGERFVELIEVCYFDFTNRLLDMRRATTCRCAACAAIGSLGLKFVTHYGTFMIDRDEDGREDLAGSDVILVHRLLKNTIRESGGPDAYAYFSDACLQRLPQGFNLPEHREDYESFGETRGGVHDLTLVAEQLREARRVYISEAEADVDVGFEVPVRPSVVWQYYVEAEKRLRHQPPVQIAITYAPNSQGRVGVGASSHCVHGVGGDGLREYLDWRPFHYFSNRWTPLPNGFELMPPALETIEFIPVGDERTAIRYRIRVQDRSDETLHRFEIAAATIRDAARSPKYGAWLRQALAEDAAAYGLDQAGDPPDRSE